MVNNFGQMAITVRLNFGTKARSVNNKGVERERGVHRISPRFRFDKIRLGLVADREGAFEADRGRETRSQLGRVPNLDAFLPLHLPHLLLCSSTTPVGIHSASSTYSAIALSDFLYI